MELTLTDRKYVGKRCGIVNERDLNTVINVNEEKKNGFQLIIMIVK